MSNAHLPITKNARAYLAHEPTGDYAADCGTGEMIATGCVAHIGRENDPFIIGEIVRAVVQSGRYSGIEVGFFSTVGAALMDAT